MSLWIGFIRPSRSIHPLFENNVIQMFPTATMEMKRNDREKLLPAND